MLKRKRSNMFRDILRANHSEVCCQHLLKGWIWIYGKGHSMQRDFLKEVSELSTVSEYKDFLEGARYQAHLQSNSKKIFEVKTGPEVKTGFQSLNLWASPQTKHGKWCLPPFVYSIPGCLWNRDCVISSHRHSTREPR